MIRLYDYPDCPFSQKVRVVLAEKELEFERVNVDLRKNEQRSAEFLKLNPLGKVPVLVDDDVVVCDSTIINEYLDDEYPNPPLRPDDSAGRARVRFLEDFCDNYFIPPIAAILTELNKPEGERDDELVRRYKEQVVRVVAMLERPLEGGEYLAGDFSLADAAFAPRVLILAQLGIELDSRFPNVAAWINRLRARPGVRALGL